MDGIKYRYSSRRILAFHFVPCERHDRNSGTRGASILSTDHASSCWCTRLALLLGRQSNIVNHAGRAGGMTEGMASFMAGMNRNIVVHSEVSPSDRQSLCWRCIGFARASRHLVFCIYLGAGGLQCKVLLFRKSIKVGHSVRALRDARRYPPSDPPQAKLAWRVRLLETLSISTTTIKFTRRLPPL